MISRGPLRTHPKKKGMRGICKNPFFDIETISILNHRDAIVMNNKFKFDPAFFRAVYRLYITVFVFDSFAVRIGVIQAIVCE